MSSKYLDMLQKVYRSWARTDKKCFSAGLRELDFVSADEKNLKAQFVITEEMTNPGGSLHGGCTASIIDIVSTLGLLCSENPRPGVSVNITVNYIGAGKIGDLLEVESQTVKIGRTLAYLNVIITNKATGKVIATGSHVKHLGS